MIQRAKTEFFSQFLDFGLLDRLDIAYCDRTKCFPTFGNIAMSWKIIQKSEKCIFDWFKVPKKCFFDNFLDFGLLDRLDIPNSDTTKSV